VHLQGKGCPGCGLESAAVARTSDTKTFVARSLEIHAGTYIYDFVEYIGVFQPVIILCTSHGPFAQTPANHLAGKGCPDCGKASAAALQTWTDEQFSSRGREVHGDQFDYGAVDYKHSQVKVKITCKRHYTEFAITPNAHLAGNGGCRNCASETLSSCNMSTREIFIQAAREIHGDRYGYERVEYLGCGSKVKIVCPHHQVFEQTPSGHLAGSGCKKCTVMGGFNKAYFEFDPARKTLPAILYLLHMSDKNTAERFLKVGITTKTVKQRFSYKKWYQHLEIEMLETVKSSLYLAWVLEQRIKQQFGAMSYRPEQRFPGETECFDMSALCHITACVRESKRSDRDIHSDLHLDAI
jgi:hypothetical protein